MDIQSSLLSTPLPVKATQLNLSQWLVGHILNATVTGRKSADTLVLQIQNQQVEAKTTADKTIIPGDQLKLVVAKKGDPVVLKVLEQTSPKVIHDIKQQILRENIPKQAGMEKLTSILSQVSSNVREAIKFLPAPIEQQFKKLIEHLPTKTNLNNEAGLKSAIKNSGIFLESKLLAEVIKQSNPDKLPKIAAQSLKQPSTQPLSQNQTIVKDLKTNLLQLSEVIGKYKQSTSIKEINLPKLTQMISPTDVAKTSPTKAENTSKVINLALKLDAETISKQIESSIARIEVNQSKAIVTHDNQTPVWTVEMPVKDKQDIDLLQLNIQADKDSKSNNEKDKLWTVNIKIDFENIGSVSAKLSIIDKEVNATLWSESEILSGLINNNLGYLNNQIERQGLSTGKIVCLDEMPITKKEQVSDINLINIKI
jgi:Flagellar hook-length control protein FliK